LAAGTGRGHVGHDVVNAVLRQAVPVVSPMPGLAAGFAARGGLGHRLGSVGGIGRGGDRGVGGVALELGLEVADLSFQDSDPLESGFQERT
jgi:hypothetical protein